MTFICYALLFEFFELTFIVMTVAQRSIRSEHRQQVHVALYVKRSPGIFLKRGVFL